MLLFDLLERLHHLQRSWFQSIPEFTALPNVQLAALYYLFRCNHYSNTPLAVAQYLGLTKGTVSQSLKKLTEQNFIYRQHDEKDRRIVRLYLTPFTKQLLQTHLPSRPLQTALSSLGETGEQLPQQLQLLLQTLQKQQHFALFGECYLCRYHQTWNNQPFCGLTQETLPIDSTQLICREFC